MKKFKTRNDFEEYIAQCGVKEGGEAVIYVDPKETIALKIFNSEIDRTAKERKIRALIEISNEFKINEIVFPQELIYVEGEFVGYSMRYIKNAYSIKDIADNSFDGTNNLKLSLKLAIKIAELVDKIHSMGMIIGDLNYKQIIISKENVYFLDTDSWGISSISDCEPDLVFFEEYADPEVIDFSANKIKYYSKETDYYSLAVIIFYMLTGVHPFWGVYRFNKMMSVSVRAKNGISLIGNHDINIINGKTWEKWMIKELKISFLDIFEYKQRYNISESLKQQQKNTAIFKMWRADTTEHWKEKNYSYILDSSECILSNRIITAIYAYNMYTTVDGLSIYTDYNGQVIRSFEPEDSEVEGFFLENEEFLVKIEPYYSGFFSKLCKNPFGYYISIYRYKENQCKKRFFTKDVKSIEIYGNNIFYVDNDGELKRITVNEDNIEVQEIVQKYYNYIKYVGTKNENYAIIKRQDGLEITFNQGSAIIAGDVEVLMKYDSVTDVWLVISAIKDDDGDIEYNTVVYKDAVEVFNSQELDYDTIIMEGADFFDGKLYLPDTDKIIVITLYSEEYDFFEFEEIFVKGISKKTVLEGVRMDDGKDCLYVYHDLNVYRIIEI